MIADAFAARPRVRDWGVVVRNVALMALLTLTTATIIHALFGSVALMTAMSLSVAYAVVVGGAIAGLLCALAVFALLMAVRFAPDSLAALIGPAAQTVFLEVLACGVVLLLALAVELRRQLAERARIAWEQDLRQAGVMQAVFDGLGPQMFVGLLTTDGALVEINDSLATVSGVPREQLIGARIDRAQWWEDEAARKTVADAVRRAAAGETLRFDIRALAAHGTIWADFAIRPLHDADGNVDYLVASALDITERRASESAQRAMFEAVPTALLLVDREGRIAMANEQAGRLLGYARSALIGSAIDRLVPPESVARHPKLIAGYFADPSARLMGGGRDLELVRADGHRLPVEIGLNPLPVEHGRYAIAAISDISDRRKAQRALESFAAKLEHEVAERTGQLQASNDRWKRHNAQLQQVGELVSRLPTCAGEADLGETIATYMPALFPYSSGALYIETDRAWLRQSRWGSDEAADAGPEAGLPETLSDGVTHTSRPTDTAAGAVQFDVPLMTAEGAVGWLRCRLPPGVTTASAGTMEEAEILLARICENLALSIANLRLRRTLEEQATRDPLTQLFNRRYLDTVGARMVAAASRHGRPLAVLTADIDHFKRINDSHGHEAGDQVLRRLAEVLRAELRASDLPCRHGGEEFVIVLPESDAAAARDCAERIRRRVASADLVAGIAPVTVSLGVAELPDHGVSLGALVAAADDAMYEAKRAGRNRVVVAGETAAS